MNAYMTRGQARIHPGDISTAQRIDRIRPGAFLAAFERQRGWQAEAELDWLVKENGVRSNAATSLIAILRQSIGAALVRGGERLAGVPRNGVAPETVPVAGLNA